MADRRLVVLSEIVAKSQLDLFDTQGKHLEQIELPGEVGSVGVGADLAHDQHGMGIRFINLSEVQQQQVAELSEQAMRRAIEEGGGKS